MYAPIQAPDDEDEERNDVVLRSRRCKQPVQESFLTYYNQKCIDFACSNSVPNPLKTSYDRLVQEGFDLASPKAKAMKRKSEAVDGGGGRVIRAAGRKDRHSKVRTARGPRDRRLRLSPATAIQFYDVQDRLGCDRPSKAIDWLIKEAKAAIDALDEQQSVKLSNATEAGSHGGTREHLNDDDEDGLVSAFSCFVNEAAPPPAAAAVYLARDGSSNSAPQNLETNWDVGRLQKMFAWNSVNESIPGNERGGGGYFSGNSPPPHATNLFREPLQSSIINHSWMSNDLAGFNFSDELSKIAASAHHQDSRLA